MKPDSKGCRLYDSIHTTFFFFFFWLFFSPSLDLRNFITNHIGIVSFMFLVLGVYQSNGFITSMGPGSFQPLFLHIFLFFSSFLQGLQVLVYQARRLSHSSLACFCFDSLFPLCFNLSSFYDCFMFY